MSKREERMSHVDIWEKVCQVKKLAEKKKRCTGRGARQVGVLCAMWWGREGGKKCVQKKAGDWDM